MKRSGFKRSIPERIRKPVTPVQPRAGVMMATAESLAAPAQATPKNPPVRDESYRRLVAKLPCMNCGIAGVSQAAHPNTGKGAGMKTSDDLCFPLCGQRPDELGCHARFDQHALYPKEVRRRLEVEWAARTKALLGR